ncbi:MAG: DUF4372 domain-containing protein [Flavobacteriales bacterium]|nr:DUF4372 domain-containing protein [Flavobacteriales bacterium]
MINVSLFSQIIQKLDRSKFHQLVKSHNSDKYQKDYSSWTQLVSMLFCQFAKSQFLRDISYGLRLATGNLNHLGIHKAPSKSTIVCQNKHKGWHLFRDYYYCLFENLCSSWIRTFYKQKVTEVKVKKYLRYT